MLLEKIAPELRLANFNFFRYNFRHENMAILLVWYL